ncbi:MAG: bifunctional oligoribonuclease/PAP phosphatase NrnA [Muribaculaceae bacterium]
MRINQVISNEELLQLKDYVTRLNNIVITCHLSPDGDAMGSSLGLMHALELLGKTVHVVTPDMPPRSLNFLPGAKDVYIYTKHEETVKNLLDRANLIFCLDYNSLKRIDTLAPLVEHAKGKKVMIDHHLDPEQFCDLTISYSSMSSTCELVFRALMGIGMMKQINRKAADCIYTGMMTDTGNFTYNSCTPDIYLIIAELVARGVNKDRIYNLAMNTSSADRLRLLGYALSQKMQVFPESHAALITLTKEELEQFNYKKGDTESLVNMPLQVPEVQWSVFLRDDEEYIKVSARSQGEFAVNTICEQHFNGGGHKNAAGGEFIGSMSDAVDVFMSLLPQFADPNVNKNNKTDK